MKQLHAICLALGLLCCLAGALASANDVELDKQKPGKKQEGPFCPRRLHCPVFTILKDVHPRPPNPHGDRPEPKQRPLPPFHGGPHGDDWPLPPFDPEHAHDGPHDRPPFEPGRPGEEGPHGPHGPHPHPPFEPEGPPHYQLRRYENSSWAVSCVAGGMPRPRAVMAATERVLEYVRRHKLFGGAPLAHVLHISREDLAAWEGSGTDQGGLELLQGASDKHHPRGKLCAAMYLPPKEDSDALPEPGKDSGVSIAHVTEFNAYATGYPGPPSPPRFIFTHLRLLHILEASQEEKFNPDSAGFLVYGPGPPPKASFPHGGPPHMFGPAWNEVLVPAGGKRFDELLLSSVPTDLLDAGEAAEAKQGAAEQ